MIFTESEVIELKSEVVSDLCKEVIAFANTKGGTLYIGVRNDGTVVGIEDADRVTLQINNMVRDSIKPDVTMFTTRRRQLAERRSLPLPFKKAPGVRIIWPARASSPAAYMSATARLPTPPPIPQSGK